MRRVTAPRQLRVGAVDRERGLKAVAAGMNMDLGTGIDKAVTAAVKRFRYEHAV